MMNTPLHVTFVLEQVLGHVTQAQNFKQFAAGRDDVEASFIDISFYREEGWIERLPLPGAVRASLRARQEVLAGLHGTPDAFFFNTQKPALFCPDVIRRAPLVIGLDVTPVQYDAMASFYGHAPDGGGPVARLKHWWNRRLFQSARRIIPLSAWCAESLVEDYGVQPGRITVIPPGVDTDFWSPAETPHDGPVRILFVGGDFARKGGHLLLHWLREGAAAEQAEVVVVTREDVPPMPRLEVHRDLQNNGEALRDIARGCDIFVLPTYADCHSLASLEAMACGLPVISTCVGGIPDIITEGETGFLIEPGDGDALAARLNMLVQDEDLRRRMGRRARDRARSHFDAHANVSRVLDEIKRAANDAQRSFAQQHSAGTP